MLKIDGDLEWDGSGTDFEWERAGLGLTLSGVGRDGIFFLLQSGMGRDGIFFLGAGWDGSENPLPCHALVCVCVCVCE